MLVQVRFFAAARERAKTGAVALELAPGATVAQALERLSAQFPALAALLPHLRVAVDQEFAAAGLQLHEGAEVALIPPVAGG